MASEQIVLQNFVGGELSPAMRGRYDLPVSKAGCRRLRNYIAKTEGNAEYRSGFGLVHNTRRNKVPFLVQFQFNDEQAYILEFTDKYLRFHKDEGIIVESDQTITGITKANPAVVTVASHGRSNGDEVFIDGVVGMTEVNGKSFIIAGVTANTFQLTDQDGSNVNSTNYTTYTSGGTMNRIYEITTPYDELLDLEKLKVTQNADTMYIDHPFYEPRKLTRTGHTAWTLALYTRTNDPFLAKATITGITQANPGVITDAAHGFVTDDVIIIEGIVGMTELNSRVYKVVKINNDSYSLKDYITGTAVDTTAYTAWSSAGYASLQSLLPSCLTFYEGRLYHGGMAGNPDQFIGSRAPTVLGVPRYEDFTSGTDADHAVYFSIADGEVNKILWLMGTNRLLFAGTFGTETRITGETSEKAITPTSINVRAENRLGVADIAPINKENIVIYVQRGNLTLRSFEFDALYDRFVSEDRNLVSDHVTKSGIIQLAWQTGRPDIVWGVLNNGRLLGLTFKSKEDISGWHVHDTGGDDNDKFLSIASMPRAAADDQLWVATERVIDGHTRRFIEFKKDPADLPDFFDFYTGDEEDDLEVFTRAMQQAQKEYVHLDCSTTFDGSDLGSDASATMTPASGALTLDTVDVVFTASAAVFKSTDVGREIWKKAIDGEGYGRGRITEYTDTTHVKCVIIQAFDSVTAMAAGNWYLTTDTISNLDYLEGREISVVTDGAVHPSQTVTDGVIELDYQASVIHVGIPFVGFLEPMNIEAGGTSGPAQAKPKNINRIGIRFLNTLGAEFGTDPYDAERVDFTEMPLQVGAPQLLFSGVKDVHLSDSWSLDKTLFVRQNNPLPCIVQFLELWVETDND